MKIDQYPIDQHGSVEQEETSRMGDARRHIEQLLELPQGSIDWEHCDVNVSGIQHQPSLVEEYSFTTGGARRLRMDCLYSKIRKKPYAFGDVTLSEFEPVNPQFIWQKTFRLDRNGGIGLVVQRLDGNLNPQREILNMSDSRRVLSRGIRVPDGFVTLPQAERRDILLNAARSVLTKNGLLRPNREGKELLPLQLT